METATLVRLPYFDRLLTRVAEPGDSEDTIRIKATLLGNSVFFVLINSGFIIFYLFYQEPAAAGMVLAITLLGLVSLGHFIWTRSHALYVSVSLLSFLGAPFVITLILGGIVNSGLVILNSSLFVPLMAVTIGQAHRAWRWYLAGLGLLVMAAVFQHLFRSSNNIPPTLIDPVLIVVNIAILAAISFSALSFIVRDRDRTHAALALEQQRSENLLLNVLPAEIAPVLKEGDRTIAEYYESASVLFADIVGSAALFLEMDPVEIVDWLNEIFSIFDRLTEQYGLEKIRTIGDNYMVASGVPKKRPDHADAIAAMALDMRRELARLPPRQGHQIQFRIGINSGPMVAGVIGKTKFHYDLWGDSVNIASRMESNGVPGKIQIAEGTYRLIQEAYHCEKRGLISIKGKGELETWFLLEKKGRGE